MTHRDGIVAAKDYTPEIHACIADLGYKMDQTCIPYKEEDILVLRHGDDVYVLANPVLGSEPIYDESGRVVDHVPMRNLTLVWQEDWLRVDRASDCLLFEVICPRLRVLRPELCIKLGAAGEVVGELQQVIEEEEVGWQTEGLERLLRGGVHGERASILRP